MEENQTVDAATVQRIHKLLALARDGGATEHEANAALSKAQEIMANNNLSMATIEAAGGSAGEGAARTRDKTSKRAMYRYQRELMGVVGEVNLCHVAVREEWSKGRYRPSGYTLIGREANVVAAREMFEYLNQTISRLVLDWLGGDLSQRMSRDAMAWCEGCAERLGERLLERHKEWLRTQREEAEARRAAQPTSDGRALVVVMEDQVQVETDLNNDYLCGWEPGTTARRRREEQAEQAARRQQRQRQAEELEAAGADPRVVKMVRMGYSPEYAMSTVRELDAERARLEAETPEQRARREAKEERQRRKDDERWRRQSHRTRRTTRAELRRGSAAFAEGEAAADQIGLDDQIDEQTRRRIE